jgi:hypothetical protein
MWGSKQNITCIYIIIYIYIYIDIDIDDGVDDDEERGVQVMFTILIKQL